MRARLGSYGLLGGLYCTTALVTLVTAATPAMAEAARADEPSATAPAAIEEVVVTGQKRLGTTTDLPVTVDVVTPEVARQHQVTDIQGLTRVITGFSFEKTSGGNFTASIRGIGTAPGATSLEQSIAPYVDGIYQAGTQRGFSWPIFDTERIEVFKGTQSGIVGQNTSVGVINIVTRKPGSDFGGFVNGSYEFENEGYLLSGAVDLPVTDKFRLRLAGLRQHVGGWIHNYATGRDIPDNDQHAIRLIGVWDISEDVTVDLHAEYDRIEQIGPAPAVVFFDPTGGYASYVRPLFDFQPGKPRAAMFDRRGEKDGDAIVRAHNWRSSATVTWRLPSGHTLTSITAASREKDTLSVDQEISPATAPPTAASGPAGQISQFLQQRYKYHQLTEELRFASPSTARLSYILGAWYRHAETDRHYTFYRDRFGAFDLANLFYDQKIDNAALFGDAQFNVTPTLSLGGSARYTTEQKTSVSSGTSNWPNTFLGFPSTRIELTPSFWDGSLRAQFRPSRAFNLYAAYSRGTKTGAVPDIVGSGILQILRPEKAETYEVGAKGSLFNRTIVYEVSAFKMNITDFQDVSTQIVNGLIVFIASNSDVETKGVDFSVRARPFDGLSVGISGEYLDAYNKTFRGPQVRSPKWSYNIDARYTFPGLVADGSVSVFGNVQHKSKYFTVPANVANVRDIASPSFTKLNVGVEYALRDNVKVMLVCRNCTNENEYLRVAAANIGGAATRYGFLNELRTITLDLRYDF